MNSHNERGEGQGGGIFVPAADDSLKANRIDKSIKKLTGGKAPQEGKEEGGREYARTKIRFDV